MEYKQIDGLPTSKYGVTVVKRCRWCYNVIQSLGSGRRQEKFGESRFRSAVWCSPECKQEESDWKYINSYRKTLKYLKDKTIEENNGMILKKGRPRIYNGTEKERRHLAYLAKKQKVARLLTT